MSSELEQKGVEIIAMVKRIPAENVRLDATLSELELDSLDMINVIFELESAFDIDIPDDEARNISSVREIIARLEPVIHERGQA